MTTRDATSPVLRAEQVEKQFRRDDDRFTIRLASLTLMPGDIVVLEGFSGSGKSTVLSLVGGAIQPTSAARLQLGTAEGTVSLTDAWQRGDQRQIVALHARDIGFVLQTGGLIPYLTIRQNLAETLRLAELNGGSRGRRNVGDLASVLSISEILDRLPGDVSVGQRQRAAFARAIVHQPALVLADEPTAALDAANADAVVRVLVDCARRLNMSAIVATHRVDGPHWAGMPRLRNCLTQGPHGPVSVFSS